MMYLFTSLELPPLSDTGRTYEASLPKASQIALHPVPPEITRNEPRSRSSGLAGGFKSTELGATVDAGVPAESWGVLVPRPRKSAECV